MYAHDGMLSAVSCTVCLLIFPERSGLQKGMFLCPEMRKLLNTMKIVYTWLFLSLCVLVPVMSQTLVFWPLTPDHLGSAEAADPAAEGFDFIRGNGLSALQFSGSGVSASNWSTATVADDAAADYYEFGLKAVPGETLDVTSLQFSERRSSAGPLQFRVFVSRDGFATRTELAHEVLPDNIYNRDHDIVVDRKIADGEILMFRLYA